ncbi:AbrB family transcriptional regulator [Clostridium sp. CCUG 7971]|uniref:AbrB family transcriptional regulator n=1 Tax=Clostridium sp. CCUG 7971 TaxID=2811414 RepID=UPI001ABA781C|nr:AbrB family transcriptional regulator [Clostridium sp. CCUG 7971]MBO3444337.1 AbrB family transcriptional regulator [Clostridium sp. CCUG 7971]
MILYFFTTILVGVIGAFIAKKLKVPAGAMVGSMVFVGIFNVITGAAYVENSTRFFVQVIAGAFIGIDMDKEKLMEIKNLIKPAIVMIIGLLILNILVGIFIYKTTSLDLLSSLFAAVPGGMADMSIISSEMGADTSMVAVFQLARLISVISIFPTLIKQVQKRMICDNGDQIDIASTIELNIDKNDCKYGNKNKDIILTLIIAIIFGIIGKVTKIPAGTMIFSLIGVAGLKIYSNKGYIYPIIKQGAQVVAGAFIGSSITIDVVYSLKSFTIPIICMIIAYTIMCGLIGFIISKWFDIDIITAMFCCTPAGASDMALIASELGINGADIALLQVTRLVSVIVIFPSIIRIIISL